MIKKSALALLLAGTFAVSAHAQTTYNGNGNTGFGGAIGSSTLTFSSDGTTLFGSITTKVDGFSDELVIYLDTTPGTGFTSTSTFTDTTGGTANSDTLREAVSGYNGTNRATLNFANPFTADFALALSPSKAQFGALYTLDNVANFTFGSDGTNGNLNLTPTNTGAAGTYTFSIALSTLGLAPGSSFDFATTYLNGASAYRSNEAVGNSITDTTNGTNTGNIAQDTSTIGFSTFTIPAAVPEPSSLALLGGPAILGAWMFIRRRRA